MKILQINESYDNTKIKCLSYDTTTSQFVLVNHFQLKFVKNKSEFSQLEAKPSVKSVIQLKNKKVPTKSSRDKNMKISSKSNRDKNKSRTRVFTCVTHEEIEEDPKYIWVDGKLEMSGSSVRCLITFCFISCPNQQKEYKIFFNVCVLSA